MAAVIRRESGAAAAAFSFEDVEQRARAIVAEAEARARGILQAAEQQARAHVESRRRAGYAEGHAQGRAEGRAQVQAEARAAAVAAAQAEVAHVVRALSAALTQLDQQKRALLAAAEAGLIELAVAIARRVCKVLVDGSAAPARANARALLESVAHHADVELCLHPDDCARLGEVAAELAAGVAALPHVSIRPDPAVARGGCVLRTRDGEIDAAIEGQLDRIAAALGAGRAAEPVPAAPAEEPT